MKITIGVLGCASIAKRLFIPNLISTGKFEIVAFASRAIEKATEFSMIFGGVAIEGYDKLLEFSEIDAIYIPLPTGMHYEWIIKSLKKGKHVFCEKSIVTSYDEVIEIIDLAKEKKLCVVENFMFLFHSQYDFVMSKLRDGAIGDIKLLRSSFGFPIFDYENNIRYKRNLGGGALFDAGAYTIMASQLFLGQNQRVIASSLNNCNQEVDFQGAIMLESEKKVVSQLAFGFDNFYQNSIELWGTKGKIIIERAFTAAPNYSPRVIIENQDKKEEYMLSADNQCAKIINKFYDSIIHANYDFQFKQIISQSRLINDVIKFSKKTNEIFI